MTPTPNQLPSETLKDIAEKASDFPSLISLTFSSIGAFLDAQHLKNIELEERVARLERPKVTVQCNCFPNLPPGQYFIPFIPCPVHIH